MFQIPRMLRAIFKGAQINASGEDPLKIVLEEINCEDVKLVTMRDCEKHTPQNKPDYFKILAQIVYIFAPKEMKEYSFTYLSKKRVEKGKPYVQMVIARWF